MPTHVALLRGVNVGGGGKLAMTDLREVVSSLGHRDVATYIQSGNVVFTAAGADASADAAVSAGTDSPGLARQIEAEMEAALESALGLRTSVVVLGRDELAAVVTANPFPDAPVPRYLHCVFLPAEPDQAASSSIAATVAAAVAVAAGQGSADKAVLAGRTVYLHTPAGFGTSGLARSLLLKRTSPVAAGTARNWATITKLLALCDGQLS